MKLVRLAQTDAPVGEVNEYSMGEQKYSPDEYASIDLNTSPTLEVLCAAIGFRRALRIGLIRPRRPTSCLAPLVFLAAPRGATRWL